jgi:hypothetical protein
MLLIITGLGMICDLGDVEAIMMMLARLGLASLWYQIEPL